jgi:type II secretory pathway component PulK
MKKKKSEKGFTLVLALVLLLVMSLMGGSLIVISAQDHSSNNQSDIYQQAFYVAETGLMEGEKFIINKYLGDWNDSGTTRNTEEKGAPLNTVTPEQSPCFNSFPDIIRTTDDSEYEYQVAVHQKDQNFGELIENVVRSTELISDNVFTRFISGESVTTNIEDEVNYLKRFSFEYFVHMVGSAPVTGTSILGSSVKKGATDIATMARGYQIYSCGMYNSGLFSENMIIPLETVVVMGN